MREYLLTILVAALVAYLLTPSVRRFAVWFGAQAVPRERDVHVIPTPRLGGLAMFGGMVAALVVATGLPEMRKVLDDGDISVAKALLLSGGLIVLIGIADDRWEVDALTKFAGQVAAAGIFIMQGIQIYVIPLPTGESLSLPPAYGVPLTVLVVVATINAVNFIDGLDGLAAGVVGIAALALFSYAYLLSRTNGLTTLTGATLVAAVLFGMCAGFLPHNFSPAKIFMGDTGSMLIGLLLSASTIMLTGQFDPAILANGLFPFFVPVLLIPAVAAVPSWTCCWRCCAAPARAGRPSPRTSSTCTTGCCSSALHPPGRADHVLLGRAAGLRPGRAGTVRRRVDHPRDHAAGRDGRRAADAARPGTWRRGPPPVRAPATSPPSAPDARLTSRGRRRAGRRDTA